MKYVAPVASIIVAALTAFNPDIQGLVSAHPALGGLFGAIGMLAAAMAPQPHK